MAGAYSMDPLNHIMSGAVNPVDEFGEKSSRFSVEEEAESSLTFADPCLALELPKLAGVGIRTLAVSDFSYPGNFKTKEGPVDVVKKCGLNDRFKPELPNHTLDRLLNPSSHELDVLKMIEELPDPATQHRLLEEFLISQRNFMLTVKQLMKKNSELRKIEGDADVGGQSLPSDGLQEVRLNMPKENNVPAEKRKSSDEAGKSVADQINEGVRAYLTSSLANVPGPPWLRAALGLLAYVSPAASYGMRAYNEKLSRCSSKVGAITASGLVIVSLAMPLSSVVAWIVFLAAWLITVAVVLFN